VPDGRLWRIRWPDGSSSDITNLSRAKDAARAWAEHQVATEDRKTNAARRLKSLDNFLWSSSLVRFSGREVPNPRPDLFERILAGAAA
jgi:hypothetical protein